MTFVDIRCLSQKLLGFAISCHIPLTVFTVVRFRQVGFGDAFDKCAPLTMIKFCIGKVIIEKGLGIMLSPSATCLYTGSAFVS